MIASTNGMNEIAMLYVVRLCEYLTEAEHVELAMAYISMGYNLAAIGYNDLADDYYNRSIELLCEYDAAKEIAETNYNKALNYIMIGKYHDAGDIVLVGMANIFKEVTDKKGFVCRYGGDEFIIVAHTTDKETLEKMVHEIYSRIEAADGFVKELKEKLGRDISIGENKRLTVSIGIALRNESDKSIDDTIKRADDLMYTVKTNGKGTYAFI